MEWHCAGEFILGTTDISCELIILIHSWCELINRAPVFCAKKYSPSERYYCRKAFHVFLQQTT